MNASGRIAQFALTLALCFCSGFVEGQEVVELYPGEIHGKTITTRNGRNISAYLGLPYAKPPVGKLRWKSPVDWRNSDEVIKADTDGNQCPQFNDDGVIVGDEDCLYLNVYTPKVSWDVLYPVMVYFHGGFFVSGSGSSTEAGPEYLLDRDVVLVTVNYRLGVFGFLSTGDKEAPGNFGLKDQVSALRWVRKYILAFGGAPGWVTIFGQDAGGVSTILHALSDENLFNQYISHSGSPFSFWAYEDKEDKYHNRAKELGDYLNCPTRTSQALVDCLRGIDTYSLVDTNYIFNGTFWNLETWVPTNEPSEVGDAFLTQVPFHKLLMRGIKDCPAIIGNVKDEGLLFTAEFYSNNTIFDTIAKDPFAFLQNIVTIFFDSGTPVKTTHKAQDFYFNNTEPSDKEAFTRNMTNFLTDAGFRVPTTLGARTIVHTTTSPVYYYRFAYRGTYSKTSAIIGNNDNVGVTHGDDLIYLFPVKNTDLQLSESDEKMIDIMLDFWTSFAYTGTPTSEHISDPNIWKPYDYELSNYLKIGGNSDPTDFQEYSEEDERLIFWDKTLAEQILGFLSFRNV